MIASSSARGHDLPNRASGNPVPPDPSDGGNVQLMQHYALQQLNAAYSSPYMMAAAATAATAGQFGQPVMYGNYTPVLPLPPCTFPHPFAGGQLDSFLWNHQASIQPVSVSSDASPRSNTVGLIRRAPLGVPPSAAQTAIPSSFANCSYALGIMSQPNMARRAETTSTTSNPLASRLAGLSMAQQQHHVDGHQRSADVNVSAQPYLMAGVLSKAAMVPAPGFPAGHCNPVAMCSGVAAQIPPPIATSSPNFFGGKGSRQVPVTRFCAHTEATSSPKQVSAGSSRSNRREQERNVPRSRLLEWFRSTRYPNLQLKDLANHVVEFSLDQGGSRFIQQKLEQTANENEKQAVFEEMMGNVQILMMNAYGNHLIQKFFELGTAEQKTRLVRSIRGNVLTLSFDKYGCQVVQKALETVGTEQQLEIVRELEGHVWSCFKDANANRVIQKIIETVGTSNLKFLIDTFVNTVSCPVYSLSTHPYGCRLIQKLLEYCSEEQKRTILEELHNHTKGLSTNYVTILFKSETLVTDQYGNYVVQQVMEQGSPEDRARIASQMKGHVLRFSQDKFASNVIEKVLVCGTEKEKADVIEEVLVHSKSGENSCPLLLMIKDQFANYVVQKMLDVADSGQRKRMMTTIKPHVPSLRKYNYGKYIIRRKT